MKKVNVQKTLKTIFILTLFMTMQSFATSKSVEGTWLYEAPTAPYEYTKGEIVIKKEKGEYNSEIKFKYNTISISSVTVEENNVIMKFYVEGELIKVNLIIDGDTFVGSSNTPEGTLKLTGKRK